MMPGEIPSPAKSFSRPSLAIIEANPAVALLAVIVFCAVLVFALAFQPDMIQVGDASYYLMLGISLAHGQGLSDISQPHAPPKHWWPAGFPLAIAFFYKLIGPHWIAAKVLILLAFYCALWLFGMTLMRRRVHPFLALLVTGCIGFSSNIHMMSSYFYNETFFLAVTLFFFALYYHWEPELNSRRVLLLSLLALYAGSIRHIGLSLPLAFTGWLAWQSFRQKPDMRWLWTIPLAGLVLYLWAMTVFPALGSAQFSSFFQGHLPSKPGPDATTGTQGNILTSTLINLVKRILKSSRGYGLSLIPQALVRSIYDLAPMSKVKALAMMAITGVALAGIWRSFRKTPLINIYALVFLSVLFLYGPHYDRLLTPLAPFLLLYLFFGLQGIVGLIPFKPRRANHLLLLIWTVVIAANAYRSFTNPREYMPAQFGNSAYQRCIDWIVSNARAKEVVVSQIHPHVFLRRGKYNVPFHDLPSPEAHLSYLDRVGADYLMVSPFYQRPTYSYMQGVVKTMEAYPQRFERISGLGDHSTYVVKYLTKPAPPSREDTGT